jgi:acetoacetyl-CoA synthetase
MRRFLEALAGHSGQAFSSYEELHAYSVDNPEKFWQLFVEYAGIPFLQPARKVLELNSPWRTSRWFVGAEVNWAHMALASRRTSSAGAVIAYDENGRRADWSYETLYKKTSAMIQQLAGEGLRARSKIAALMPNSEETLLILLASVSLGATFSSTSPDFGVGAAADRLSQFGPEILTATTHYFFKGKEISILDKIVEIAGRTPSLKSLVVFRSNAEELAHLANSLPGIRIIAADTSAESAAEISFEPYSFQDPLYVMYSSGTTGLPKCIVQGHGVIINHAKEHLLHTGATADDTVFYYTTCGWMMYNWLVSGLVLGERLLLFDGNPFYRGPGLLWNLARETGVTIFGTSAKYLTTLQQHNFDTLEANAKSSIKTILSTGSVLPPEGFKYVYEHIHPTARLSSISGGTDLNGCWALGNPDLAVIAGELQSRGLGMAVKIFDDAGQPLVGTMGELVCTAPFPSMPLEFLGDADGTRYRSSYFDRFGDRDVWAHGDFAMLTANGGMIFSGRSDATLNPGGVRIGTAEIYRVLEALPFVEDTLIIGRPSGPDDEEIVLFVKMRDRLLNGDDKDQIRKLIREKVSPRHVPGEIREVQGIPYTINGKKVELAVKYIALGRAISNRETIANKEVLAEYEEILAPKVSFT